ncbi:hypothetical protein JMJ58_05845 [Haloterrigena salifodinae]|uniref:Uncharacterized protein n=1 Tax=Haloterrigena salifodinae TaxID=2675099 RepID=A0A8T8E3U3_9EURY|nr:hypothetical protein [Haloterrigena salifodinae]QRV16408.1 hypothetical protein JMJ58_05845 [Haloterrigena salifodinae]
MNVFGEFVGLVDRTVTDGTGIVIERDALGDAGRGLDRLVAVRTRATVGRDSGHVRG